MYVFSRGFREDMRTLLRRTALILREGYHMSAELDALAAEVAADGAVVASAVKLIQGLEAQIAAAGTDPVKLKQLTDDLATQRQQLADAVATGTPPSPPENAPPA